jgi:hypothetical protein
VPSIQNLLLPNRLAAPAVMALVAALNAPAFSDTPAKRDVRALFSAAEALGRVGTARKTKPVDARPARAGEIVVTSIAGEGTETQSKPARVGDMVVRNRCPETGNEQYLVAAPKFAGRYAGPYGIATADGWSEYRPISPEMSYFIVDQSAGDFVFTAPWGEDMVARPGDAIVRSPNDPADTYRVAAASFACTYEIVKAAP